MRTAFQREGTVYWSSIFSVYYRRGAEENAENAEGLIRDLSDFLRASAMVNQNITRSSVDRVAWTSIKPASELAIRSRKTVQVQEEDEDEDLR